MQRDAQKAWSCIVTVYGRVGVLGQGDLGPIEKSTESAQLIKNPKLLYTGLNPKSEAGEPHGSRSSAG